MAERLPAEATLMARRVSCHHGMPPISVALLTSFILAAAARARAQEFSTITGVVIDQAESVISGARVTATNAGNASVQTVLTDAAGAFWLRGLAETPQKVEVIDAVDINLFDTFYYEKLGFPLQGASFKLSYRLGF